MSLWTAVIGSIVVFSGAYLVEKGRGLGWLRSSVQLLAMVPLAVPGLVLGICYIFFFNAPSNPFNFIVGTMGILVLSTIVHFYTVSHLTAVTALKQIDPEFESVSASLKVPFYQTFCARHRAGLHADHPRYRALSVRQRDDHGIGGRLPVLLQRPGRPPLPCSPWTTPAASPPRRRWR